MMLVVNEVIRALNARATTSPTATTITSPRIRKFLKPLIIPSPIRDSRPTGRDARPSPVFPAGTPSRNCVRERVFEHAIQFRFPAGNASVSVPLGAP